MALYIFRVRPKNDLSGLRKELNSGEISRLRSFGKTLQYGLDNAKIDPKDGLRFIDRRRLLYFSISHGKRKCSCS